MKIDELLLELSANKTEKAGEQGLQIEALQVTSTIAPIISKESEDTGDEAPIFKSGNEVTIFQSRIITSGNIPKALIDSDSENMGIDLFGDYNIISYEKDQTRVDDETSSDTSNGSTTLLINEIVDLEIENSESPVAETAQSVLSEDLDYDPSEVLNSFLERERQNR
ncbi:1063_t:CDS:2 [Gigaspora rosea]|nr:1063_t:CDS:2 [Gigaspora rosea]